MLDRTENKPVAVGALNRRNSAIYLGISTRLLDDLASRGEIARTKIGRKTVFRIAELERYLKSKEVSQ